MEEKRLSKSQEKYESKTLTGMKMEEKRVSNSQEKFENLTEEKQISKSRNLPIDLILILLATISCLIFEFTVPNKSFVEIIFGLLFVLFLPGYSLIAVLFPKKNDLEKMERMALSFGLSMLIAPIVGLFLNSTFYGINLTPLTIILAIFTIVVEIFAFIRRQNVPEDDRFIVEFKNYFSKTTEEDGVKDR